MFLYKISQILDVNKAPRSNCDSWNRELARRQLISGCLLSNTNRLSGLDKWNQNLAAETRQENLKG